jgi:hypothetical protein
MGTSFSVVYTIIFMIWLETPIISNRRFSQFIKLYKRFIDDLLIIWTGTPERLCELRKALEEADVNISLDWSGYSSKEDAVDPMIVDAVDHTQVNYLDPDMSLKADIVTGNGFKSIFSPFRKPGNAYAYIPFNSFHARHTFRGWILAELLRLLTHSSSPETWREEGLNFYYLLCSRGYPRQFLVTSCEQCSRRFYGKEGLRFYIRVRIAVAPANIFQDLPSLCPDTPQRSRMALAERATGSESARLCEYHLCRHFSAPGISSPVQCTATRIDSETLVTLMNQHEKGALGEPTRG